MISLTRPDWRKRSTLPHLVGVFLCMAGGAMGCGESAGPRTDSNSNWLRVCIESRDCSTGDSCTCGVCTRPCFDATACQGLAGATCVTLDSAALKDLCGPRAEPTEPLCLPSCELDDDCAEGQLCSDGACIVPDAGEAREAALCEMSGGTWDESACGHTVCDLPPDCEEVVPGCDCGPNSVFEPESGCMVTPDCIDLNQSLELCRDTGGLWVSDSCGHWECGQEPACEALIPGCNCGEGNSFGDAGCAPDDTCAERETAELCADTGGVWSAEGCGHTECGAPPECQDDAHAGCDCGPEHNFDPVDGCFADEACTIPEPDPDEVLCSATGGSWDPDGCGHTECGLPTSCEVPIPGCDCGPERGFFEGDGCLPDDACVEPDPGEALCSETEGTWIAEGCGHTECGETPTCDLPSPGCDCGDERNFGEGEGCVADEACVEPDPAEVLCVETEGTWTADGCGHAHCGETSSCEVPTPGCNCGPNRNFVAEEGCVANEECAVAAIRALCEDTDGTWAGDGCGHTHCGEPPACGDPQPSCNCGAERNFIEGEGCVVDAECGPSAAELLCAESEGTWDVEACGHYLCGEAPACGEVVGGCNCGPERRFFEVEGCVVEGCP